MGDDDAIREGVKEYYGKVLCGTADIKTTACGKGETPPPFLLFRRGHLAFIQQALGRQFLSG